MSFCDMVKSGYLEGMKVESYFAFAAPRAVGVELFDRVGCMQMLGTRPNELRDGHGAGRRRGAVHCRYQFVTGLHTKGRIHLRILDGHDAQAFSLFS